MILLSDLDFSLPLKNPVIIFSLVLFIILFAPILFNKIKIPHVIGLIAAGIVVGPYGLNLLRRDSSIVLFGTVGLIYIMFIAGLEIDLDEFKKNKYKSLVFGLFTFIIPMILGTLAGFYVLNYDLPTAILLAGMFSSHTLLAYPIASRYGVARIRSVTLTIGGTIITDILALLVLATIVGITKGELTTMFWIQLGISTIIFAAIVVFIFPLIARWFFKKFDDSISQYIFVLALVFLGSFLAEAAGLEAIVGAFLSGLVLNRFIPHSSALMNRIDFVGNAFFIPFFLIGVGMLVNFNVIFQGWGALKVAGVMIVLAVAAKYIAAWLTQKTFRLDAEERDMIFGLSNARVGATLAIVLVGYNVILSETPDGEPIRLLNEDILNGTILMILVTCTISSFVVEKASRKIALQASNETADDGSDKILISLAYPEKVTDLVDLGLLLKPSKSNIPVYALHVVLEGSNNENTQSAGKKMLDKAVKHAIASDNIITPLTRHDVSISNGIVYTIKENNISDLVIGLHHNAAENNFLGTISERVLRRLHETIFIYKPVQPLNTLKRMVVVVPPKAEMEPGFIHWFEKLIIVAKEGGLQSLFYATPATINYLRQANNSVSPLKIVYNEFFNWEDFLIFSKIVKPNDLFVIVTSRKGHASYLSQFDKLPYYLIKYFVDNSFIMLYPSQLENGLIQDIPHTDTALFDTIASRSGVLKKAGNVVKGIFGQKKK
ncbi:MAG: cation:proton antiporter domain-containing protein [Ilyomonas sp.]